MLITYELGILKNNPFDLLCKISEGWTDLHIQNRLLNFQKLGHTFCKSVILAHISETGETNNYSALSCHVDGNKSHEVETLAYNGRTSEYDTRESVQIVDNMKHAYLFCVNSGIIMRVKTGVGLIHCNLTKIQHVPDTSRNYTNYSRAYGPP